MTAPNHSFINLFGEVSRFMKAETERRLSIYGVHVGQQFLLEYLWERDGRSPGELAALLNVERSTITQTVRRMTAAGLVWQQTDDEDGRRTKVSLTGRGRALQGTLPGVMAGLEGDALSDLSDAERTELMRLLGQIHATLTRQRDEARAPRQ
jgi:MarR family transcriptional regulator, organic hydroperoxide resistance regulator